MKKSFPLHTQIFIGMLVGILGGAVVQSLHLEPATVDWLTALVKPVGDVFLRMIFMMVIPLLLCALTLGVASLGDLKRIGRIGLRVLVYTLVASSLSVMVGVGVFNVFQSKTSLNAEQRTFLVQKFADKSGKINQTAQENKQRSIGDILTVIVPKNPVEDMAKAFDPTHTGGGLLAVMFFALILGISLSMTDPQKAKPVHELLEGLYEVIMKAIGIGMKLAPFGVAALLFMLVANTGLAVLELLIRYVFIVLLALAIQQFVVYSLILKFACKMSPIYFFKSIREVMLTAFSTSSSNATLPTAIRVTVEELHLPAPIARFVLTIGSTANQNGTALYEGITVLFLAQCFGVELGLGQQVLVVLMSILAGVGTAGVPGGSLPMIVMILIGIGVPGESIAIIYGVDRLLDMCRTVLNVTGDITAAVFVSRIEAPAMMPETDV